MSALNILNLITRGEWVAYCDRGVGAREPDRGLVHLAAVAPQRRPGANEGEANQKLIVLAPDHALLLRAQCLGVIAVEAFESSGVASISFIRETRTADGLVSGIVAEHDTPLDACGCPALTPELRISLRAACGLDARLVPATAAS